MAVSFEVPNRKNVVTTLITDPLSLNIVGVEDALSLNTLLPTAIIAFQADGQNFTHSLNVTAWTNNGTGGTTYDASTRGITANEPVFDGLAADNPFKAPLGALYFVDAENAAGDFLNLANKFSTSGAFVMYAVFANETGFDANYPPTLISVNSSISSGKSLHVFDHVKSTVSIWDANGAETALPQWRASTTTPAVVAATPYVIVVRRDAVGNMFCYDASSGSIIDRETIDEVGFELSFDAMGMAGLNTREVAAGKGSYLAAFGIFNSDIGSQKSQGLARLLGKKYIG